MKRNGAPLALMIGSFCWLGADVWWMARLLFEVPASDWIRDNWDQFLPMVLNAIGPLCLLLHAISLLGSGGATGSPPPLPRAPMQSWSAEPSQSAEAYPTTQQETGADPSQDMTVGSWLLTFFLTSIPIVGFVLLIVWACEGRPSTRKTWALSMLAWLGIMVLLGVAIVVLSGMTRRF